MQTLTLINGNKQKYAVGLPRLHIIADHFNAVAIEHVKENTGLSFQRITGGWEAQPETAEQIVKLFLTYNYKTQYHDNGDTKNTLYLKSCNKEGFKVKSICFDCIKENQIFTGNMTKEDRLSV